MEVTFLENALIRGIFTYALPHSKVVRSCHNALGRRKLLNAQGSILSKFCFSQRQERGGGNYDLLYRNPVRKYEDDLAH